MRYASTRGDVSGLSFRDAVMMGLAADGGLLVPETIPDLSNRLDALAGKSYTEIAGLVMGLFIDDIPEDDLSVLIQRSYAAFDDASVTPLKAVGDFHVLELFHGPTLAFKDVALQFLGNVFEYIIAGDDSRLNILGATSGDTGSAAIAGVRGKKNIHIFVMFPEGRISALQEKQMTTILDDNVHNLAIEGSFDDCQSIMKAVMGDLAFKAAWRLGAVNSVNWARVLAQVVYYFSAYAQLGCPGQFDVAVPTGNFGNVFAGYVARKMGLPVRRLILATNRNDILHRFFTSGRYERGEVHISHSPAMDIQVASNFERYLYYQFEGNPEKVRAFMAAFFARGVSVAGIDKVNVDAAFASGAASDEETLGTITGVYRQTGYLIDPHTAAGVCVGLARRDPDLPLVCMATAHPAKFTEAMALALPEAPVRHPALDGLAQLPMRKTLLPNDASAVKRFIETLDGHRAS